ncbi:MAG TPA: methyltransferase domain-containing protein [Pseudonocardia sp.]|jgi:SAM-dependent methyltransferase|nr:methyltransferase domain-containing protein [Pseudonocardia sp.]
MDTRQITTPPPDIGDLRARLHGMWAAVAPAWGEHAEYVDARRARVTDRMLDLTTPRRGERVLELACGPGGLGLAAAARVAPDGEVVQSDVVAEMTAIAAARARTLDLTNVRTRVLDLERIAEPDRSYDVVLCSEGLMFVPEPVVAAREIRRVLRPGGRVALTVWGPRACNPWLGVVFDAVGAQIGRPVPPPGVPGPFSLADRDALVGLLRDADLVDVEVEELDVPLRATGFEEWWTRTSALAGPLAAILAALSEDALQAIHARLRTAVASYRTPTGLVLPGVTLLASARRAPVPS